MEPFAVKSGSRRNLHWWVTAAAAIAFFVWVFDVIPGIHSAATGKVAETADSNAPPADPESEFSDDWSGLLSESESEQEIPSDFADEDPLAGILNAEKVRQNGPDQPLSVLTEPEGDSTTGGVVRAVSRGHASEESSVETASWESKQDSAVRPSASSVPAAIPSDVAQQLHDIEDWLQKDQILEAHAELSRIYWKFPEYRDLIQERLSQTASIIFTTPDRQFGPPHFVEYGETLESIARQYDVPWNYLAMLNRVKPEDLQAGQQLKVVRGPFGAVVDLSAFSLTVHAHGWYVNRYTVGIGRDEKTPLGKFRVEDKLENPVWYNPDGGVVEADDPQNPLGEYWIGLGNHIGIHGTNDPDSIGKAASRGCIHLGD